jgi:DNA-binding NtrC family response regulator
LDEIQHLSLECQHQLYDFLVSKKNGSKSLDVRLIASSSTPLLSQVASGQFLRDLYDTLNELPIQIEPLKDRREDIQPLIEYYIGRYNRILKKNVKGIEKDCLKLLIGYSWPGNIRQLESVIEQMVHASNSTYLRFIDLPDHLIKESVMQKYQDRQVHEISSPQIAEQGEIITLLKQEHGHMKTVAALMDMPLSTLYRKCTKYNIDPKQYREW